MNEKITQPASLHTITSPPESMVDFEAVYWPQIKTQLEALEKQLLALEQALTKTLSSDPTSY